MNDEHWHWDGTALADGDWLRAGAPWCGWTLPGGEAKRVAADPMDRLTGLGRAATTDLRAPAPAPAEVAPDAFREASAVAERMGIYFVIQDGVNGEGRFITQIRVVTQRGKFSVDVVAVGDEPWPDVWRRAFTEAGLLG